VEGLGQARLGICTLAALVKGQCSQMCMTSRETMVYWKWAAPSLLKPEQLGVPWQGLALGRTCLDLLLDRGVRTDREGAAEGTSQGQLGPWPKSSTYDALLP
jgi:hypothetical protein